MRTLKRILVFILFTMALIGAVGGLKYKKVYAVDYVTVLTIDFEHADYVAGSTYNSTRSSDVENVGSYYFYYGTPSTNDALAGTKSGQMRWYSSAAANIPYVILTFTTPVEADKIIFKYKVGNVNVDFDVMYSSEAEGAFTALESINTTGTSTTSYSTATNSVITSTITVKRFKIQLKGTAPTSGTYNFIFDDLVFYAEASGEQLTSPTNAAIAETTLSFNAVTHASSYNVGFFENEEAESPTKVVNINTTSYTFTQQSTDGNNYIKIQAVGDGVNYTNSTYTNVGTYTYTDIPVKTIAQVSSFGTETAAPYSYYDITGTVSSITNASNGSFNITDGNNILSINGLSDTKDGDPKTIAFFGFVVGDTVRIKAYKSVDNETVQLKGYFVSYTVSYGGQFASLSTLASLKVDYTSNMSVVPNESNTSMILPSESKGNFAEGIQIANALGFNNYLFSIAFSKNAATTDGFIGKDSVRLYKDKNGGTDGGAINISGKSGIRISKVVLTILNSYNSDTKVMSASEDANENIENLVRTYTFNSPSNSITIQNIGTGTAGFGAMTIYYEGSYASSYTINTETVAAEEKPLVSLMFGSRFSNTLKDNLDGSGTVVTYGIVYAKKDDLDNASKTLAQALDAGDSFVHTVEGTPVKVDADGTANESGDYSQIGVSLNHIPETSYVTEITAAVYVCVDGEYYLMNTKAYSVKDIAQSYLDADYTPYFEHTGILNYLATYGD